jgi:GxxExxY protein
LANIDRISSSKAGSSSKSRASNGWFGVHQAQVLAYMRVLQVPVGLLVNFNGEVLRTGVKRLVI